MQPIKMNCRKFLFMLSCLKAILNANALEIYNNLFALLHIQFSKGVGKDANLKIKFRTRQKFILKHKI